MIEQKIPINFTKNVIIFFILLETITVPMVALSNSFAAQNMLYMCIMGFTVAFIAVLFLARLLKGFIIRNSQKMFGQSIDNVSGLWYIGILAGILEMAMFAVQDILFAHHWDDFSTGFASALISVAVTLIVYELVAFSTNFGIKFYQRPLVFQLRFTLLDIILLSFLFAGYEFIVCPITGLWIPYREYRVAMAILSGILGGGSGGILLYCLSRILPFKAYLTLRQE